MLPLLILSLIHVFHDLSVACAVSAIVIASDQDYVNVQSVNRTLIIEPNCEKIMQN
jgi:hypothetical protein